MGWTLPQAMKFFNRRRDGQAAEANNAQLITGAAGNFVEKVQKDNDRLRTENTTFESRTRVLERIAGEAVTALERDRCKPPIAIRLRHEFDARA